MKGIRLVVGGLALGLAVSWAAVVSGQDLWEQDKALQAAMTGPVDLWRARLEQALAHGPDPIQAALGELVLDKVLSDPARERVLYDFASALRVVPETEAGRAALGWLLAYESKVLVPHPEAGEQYPIPLYQVSIAAQGTRNAWTYAAARQQTLELIESKNLQALDFTKFSDIAARRGAISAFRAASPAALEALRGDLLTRTKSSQELAPVTAIAAMRLNDMELYGAVLASPDQEAALSILPGVIDAFPSDAAFQLLMIGFNNESLASASLLQMARLHGKVPAADDFLFDTLSDRKLGGSAAAALAQTHDPVVVNQVDALLTNSTDRFVQARAVLALQLEGSDLAIDALKRFSDRSDVHPQLHREVNQWLAR